MSDLHPDDELPRFPASWSPMFKVPTLEQALDRGIVCCNCAFLFPAQRLRVAGDRYGCQRCGSTNIDFALL